MRPTTSVLESQLREANDHIRVLEQEAAVDHEAAENLAAELREGGRNPLLDKEAFDQVDAAYAVADGKKQEAAEIRQRREALMEKLGRSSEKHATVAMFKNAAEAIIASPEWQRLKEVDAFASQGSHIDIPGVEVLDRDRLVAAIAARRPFLAADPQVDGAATVPIDQQLYPPVGIPVRPLRVLDLIMVGTTESEQVNYTQETVRTDVAAETAVGTAYSEATYTYALKSANVRSIGHWTSAARTQLADQGQLQALISGRLEYGVNNRLDGQILNGDGTGQNLKGILNTSGIGSINRNGTASERKVEAIHRGITWVRLNGFLEPEGIVIHPQDYEDVLFEKDTEGDYLLPGVLGGISGQMPVTIWGKPMAITTAIAQHSVLVGAFKAGATLWMRSGVSVRATDSHSDFFVKQLVALLAELRAAFACQQPNYFADCDIS